MNVPCKWVHLLDCAPDCDPDRDPDNFNLCNWSLKFYWVSHSVPLQ